MPLTRNIRFILGYLVFVALPVAGLVACLRQGQTLNAPAALAGQWRLRSDSSPPCLPEIPARGLTFNISQSGEYLSLSLSSHPEAAASGTIHEKTIVVSVPSSRFQHAQPGCEDILGLRISAVTGPGSRPESLTGSLSFDGCDACPSMALEAARQRSGAD